LDTLEKEVPIFLKPKIFSVGNYPDSRVFELRDYFRVPSVEALFPITISHSLKDWVRTLAIVSST